jgi:hypothetical protein
LPDLAELRLDPEPGAQSVNRRADQARMNQAEQ